MNIYFLLVSILFTGLVVNGRYIDYNVVQSNQTSNTTDSFNPQAKNLNFFTKNDNNLVVQQGSFLRPSWSNYFRDETDTDQELDTDVENDNDKGSDEVEGHEQEQTEQDNVEESEHTEEYEHDDETEEKEETDEGDQTQHEEETEQEEESEHGDQTEHQEEPEHDGESQDEEAPEQEEDFDYNDKPEEGEEGEGEGEQEEDSDPTDKPAGEEEHDQEEQPEDEDESGGNGGKDYSCQKTESWPKTWVNSEQKVLDLVNENRRRGASCGGQWYRPVPPLKFNGKLIRSSRCHAVDMVEKNYFDHQSPDGQIISDRLNQVGYSFGSAGENIAQGQRSPEHVVQSWMNSPGHCANIMRDFKEIGIGYVADHQMWVQNFGTSF